jgi:hypothetical protein
VRTRSVGWEATPVVSPEDRRFVGRLLVPFGLEMKIVGLLFKCRRIGVDASLEGLGWHEGLGHFQPGVFGPLFEISLRTESYLRVVSFGS